jgi:hypothetical protein
VRSFEPYLLIDLISEEVGGLLPEDLGLYHGFLGVLSGILQGLGRPLEGRDFSRMGGLMGSWDDSHPQLIGCFFGSTGWSGIDNILGNGQPFSPIVLLVVTENAK